MKKILALVMVFAICISMAPVGDVYASDYADPPALNTPSPTVAPEVTKAPVISGGESEKADSYVDESLSVDKGDADEVVAGSLSEMVGGEVSKETASEIIEIAKADAGEKTSVVVVESGAVLSSEAIKKTASETSGGISFATANVAASENNTAGDFVVVSIAEEEVSKLKKDIDMSISATSASHGANGGVIDINKVEAAAENVDTVVIKSEKSGAYGATINITTKVSMTVAKNSDGAYPHMSIFASDGEVLGSVNLEGLASAESIIVPIEISDDTVAKNLLSAFSIAPIRYAYAAEVDKYAEIFGSVDDKGNITVSKVKIVSDTIVPFVVSVLSHEDLFTAEKIESADKDIDDVISSGDVEKPEAGVSPWIWMVVALAVVAGAVVIIMVVSKRKTK